MWSFELRVTDSGKPAETATSTSAVLTVQKASPSIAISLSSTSIVVGHTATGSAVLSGGYNVSGNVTYYVYSNGACSGTGIVVGSPVKVASSNVPSSASQVFNSAGTSGWYAVYSGDANNNPITSKCQALTVSLVISAPTSVTIGAGSTVHFMVNATDPDSTQPIQLNVNNRPSGASFPPSQSSSIVSSLFTWTPTTAGNYNVTFTAEAGGVTTSLEVTIHVNAAAKAAPLPILQYSIFGIVGFLIVLSAAVILRRFQNPKRKLSS
jgi:hypothetical protein